MEFGICSEQNPHCREFIEHNFPREAKQLLHSVGEYIDAGFENQCSQRLDIMSIGPPCPPWSPLRTKSSSSSKTAAPESHPDWTVAMELLPSAVEAHRPYMLLVEEVFAITKKGPGGESSLSILMTRLRPYFVAMEVVCVDSKMWVKNKHRSRTSPLSDVREFDRRG